MSEKRVLEFIVFDPPTPMGRKRWSGQNNGKRFYTEKKDVRSVYHIRQAFLEYYPSEQLIDGAVRLSVRLWHKCPSTMSRKKRIAAWMDAGAMNTKPDLNNVLNQICDALTNYAYIDDRQVRLGYCDKYYALDREGNDTPPRMTITLEEL